MRPLLFPIAACALALAAVLACKPDEARSPPAADASPAPTYNYGMVPTAIAPAGTPSGSGAAGTGIGCNGDAERIPTENEQALRACCTKLGNGNACVASACWIKGTVASMQSAIAPGGRCTK